MSREEHLRKVNKVIARAWVDPAFKAELKADPHGVLTRSGCRPSETVQVHEESAEVCHFVIPQRPSGLSDDDLSSDDPHPDICSTVCVLCT